MRVFSYGQCRVLGRNRRLHRRYLFVDLLEDGGGVVHVFLRQRFIGLGTEHPLGADTSLGRLVVVHPLVIHVPLGCSVVGLNWYRWNGGGHHHAEACRGLSHRHELGKLGEKLLLVHGGISGLSCLMVPPGGFQLLNYYL